MTPSPISYRSLLTPGRLSALSEVPDLDWTMRDHSAGEECSLHYASAGDDRGGIDLYSQGDDLILFRCTNLATRGTRMSLAKEDLFVITWLKAGEVRQVMPSGQTQILIPGACSALPPNGSDVFAREFHDETALSSLSLIATPAAFRRAAGLNQLPRSFENFLAGDEPVQDLMIARPLESSMGALDNSENWPTKRLRMRAMLNLFCCELLLAFDRRDTAKAVAPRALRSLERVQYLLDERLTSPPTIAELCDIAGMSRSTLTRAFRRFTGVSVAEYGLERRLDMALRLLVEERQSVAEVSNHVGYADVSSFARAFHRRHGITPRTAVQRYNSR